MHYFKVQTNRVSIKKLLTQFRTNLSEGEYLIAPRPLPGQVFQYYYALVCVNRNSRNMQMVSKYKNCDEIRKQEFENQQATIEFKWSVQKRAHNKALHATGYAGT